MSEDILKEAMALFGTTQIAPVQNKTKGKKTKDHATIALGKDLDALAALRVVSKALESQAEILEADLKLKVREEFGRRMFQQRTRPETFIGTGPRSDAYVELRKKGSNRPLDPDVVADLDRMRIPYDRQESVPARLVINPEVLENQDQLRAIAEAIRDCEALNGVHVILQQEAQFHYSVSDETIPQLARAVATEEEAIDMLPKVANFSIGKFQIDKIKDPSLLIEKALEIIRDSKLLSGGLPELTEGAE